MTEKRRDEERKRLKLMGWDVAQVEGYFTGRIVKHVRQGDKRAKCEECGLRIRGVGHVEGQQHKVHAARRAKSQSLT